jgi:hypothetical protein
MTTIRGPAALATALLLATLSLTACTQQAGTDLASPAGTAEPAGRAPTPVPTVCNPGLPESAYRACTKNQRATFPRPPVPYQHVAE